MKVRAERPVKVNGKWYTVGEVFEMPDELYRQASCAVRSLATRKAPKGLKTAKPEINEVIQVADEVIGEDGEEDDDS